MPTLPIPIAVVDDHTLFRNALTDMIHGTERFKVVVQAANGAEYLRAVQNGAEVAVAVVDLHMPVMDGFETIAWIRAHAPGTRALALSFELSAEARERALQAGACGFLRKDIRKSQFLEALEQVALVGHYQLPAEEEVRDKEEPANRRHEVLSKLTPRDLELIGLLCRNGDLTNEQLADKLQVHRRTIDGYLDGAYKKCDVHSKAGLVAFAYKLGLVQ